MTSHSDSTKRTPLPMQLWQGTLSHSIYLILEVRDSGIIVKNLTHDNPKQHMSHKAANHTIKFFY